MTVDEAIKFSEQELASLDPGLADRALEVLAAEVRRLRQEVEWQPIETAPHDDIGNFLIGRSESAGIPAVHQCIFIDGAAIGVNGIVFREPTHWRKMPEPPQ